MSIWESAAIVAEKGNTKSRSHGLAAARNVSFQMVKLMKLAAIEEHRRGVSHVTVNQVPAGVAPRLPTEAAIPEFEYAE